MPPPSPPAPPAKVLFITRKWAPATGGMETYSLRLTQELATTLPLGVMALAGRANGMPPGALALIGFGLRAGLRLLLPGRKPRPATVHLGDMALWPLGLMAARSATLVLSAHGTDVAYHRRGGIRGGLYGAYLRLGARLLGRAKVIANSRATADMLAQTGWRAAGVVPLGSDFSPHGNASEPERAVLFAGRLVERKGCGWFIRAVLDLLPRDVVLKVAGPLWDKGESAALAHPRVRYLGPLAPAQLAHEYASAACVIVPNITPANGEYEGFGLVAPEAAMAGGVVLAAASGGLCDAVIDGETGFLLPEGDAAAWAAKIADIAAWSAKGRAAFIANAQSRARAHFCWSRVARETAVFYG